MLKEIESALNELFDIKLSKKPRPDLDARYRSVSLRNTGQILYINKSEDYATTFKLKANLEILLSRVQKLEKIEGEHTLLSAELEAMHKSAHADLNDEMEIDQEFDFIKDFNAKYALFKKEQLIVNIGLDPFTLATAKQRLAISDTFEVFIQQGELIGYKTEIFCLIILSKEQFDKSLKNVLQAKLWWLTRAYKQSTSELDVIFKTFPDSYFRLDSENKIRDHKGLVYPDTSSDVLGRPIENIMPNEEVGELFTEAIQQAKEIKSLVSVEYALSVKNQNHTYEARFAPLRKNQFIIIIRDITERKKVEEKLSIKHEQTKTLYATTQALSSTLDINFIFTLIFNELKKVVPYDSASVQQIKDGCAEIIDCWGFSEREKIVGVRFDLKKKDSPSRLVIAGKQPMIMNTSDLGNLEFQAEKYATFKIKSWLGVPLLFGGKPIGLIALHKKETGFYTQEHAELVLAFAMQAAVAIENSRLFDEAQKAKEEALEASRLKSKFLASVSHELRTPLGSILGYSELLYDDTFGVLLEQQKNATKKVVDSSHYLTDLINDLLEHAQIESGSINLNIKPFNIDEMLNDVKDKVDVLALEKGLSLTFEKATNIPTIYLGDKRRIQQILINLLGNAIKFSDVGSIELRIKHKKKQIIFEVEDTGIGIPEDARSYIFETFRQVADPTLQKQAGTGLGLPIAKQLAIAMGGNITLESELGKGSTFSVFLPISPPKKEKII